MIATTVIAGMKKKPWLFRHANPALLSPPRSRVVRTLPEHAAAVDEMWSFVSAKEKARWLWQAIDPHTGSVLAYVVGTRKEAVFLKLQALLAPFSLTHYYPAKAGVYERNLLPERRTGGKRSRQKSKRKPLTVRTRLKRLARKTLCFPRSRILPDLLLGFYMNQVELSQTIPIKIETLPSRAGPSSPSGCLLHPALPLPSLQ